MALDYFGEESLPPDLVEIPLEYFKTAIEVLGDQDGVDGDRIVVQGISRGGALALLLGATFPQIHAVVKVVPSGVVWKGCCSSDALKRPAWTHNGDQIMPSEYNENDPDMQVYKAEESKKIQAGEPVALTSGFLIALEKATNLQAATIPVEKTQGLILFISGEADDLWPSTELAELSVKRLRETKFRFRFEHLRYEDASHIFLYAFLPTKVSNERFLFGDTPAGNAKAAADAGSHILPLYDEKLGR